MYVTTNLLQERLHLLKPMSVIDSMDDNDEYIYQIGMVERYSKRPGVLEDLFLANFSHITMLITENHILA